LVHLQRIVDYAACFNGCANRLSNNIVAAEIEAKQSLPLRQHKCANYSKVFDQCKRRVRGLQRALALWHRTPPRDTPECAASETQA
jgi:hypothetical protein